MTPLPAASPCFDVLKSLHPHPPFDRLGRQVWQSEALDEVAAVRVERLLGCTAESNAAQRRIGTPNVPRDHVPLLCAQDAGAETDRWGHESGRQPMADRALPTTRAGTR